MSPICIIIIINSKTVVWHLPGEKWLVATGGIILLWKYGGRSIQTNSQIY